MKSLFSIISVFIVTLGFSQSVCTTCLNHTELGISFPPVKDETQRDFAQPVLDEIGVKKIRFAENWSLREPLQGSFNWGPLDDRLTWAQANNYEVLLTIQSNGPDWACSSTQNDQSCVFNDNEDFKFYIDTLLKRHGDKISKIQFGNEWQSDFWYKGTANDFITAHNVLYNAVQEHASNVDVVLGGFTTISLRWLAGCNVLVTTFTDDEGITYDSTTIANTCPTPDIQDVTKRIEDVLEFAQYDLVDIHLYDDVEQWDEYYENFQDMVTKPIIVSEFGGPNLSLESSDDLYQRDRFIQYVHKLDSLEISEAYFFKLVEGTANEAHASSGLIDDTTLTKKPIFDAFKEFSTTINGIEDQLESNSYFTIAPNPSNGELHITLKEFELSQNLLINIIDLNGQIIKSQESINTKSPIILSIIYLKSGLYVLQIGDEQENNYSKKFTVK